jgi:DNA-binding GntR family transcriptional regulator
MKRVIERKDLMSKSEYSKQYGVNRMTIDKLIEEGKLVVERISGVDYIRLKAEASAEIK